MSFDPDSQGWFGTALKTLAAAVSAAFAWVWHTSHEMSRLKGKVSSLESRQQRIETGINRILNHLTGTHLHDIGGDDE